MAGTKLTIPRRVSKWIVVTVVALSMAVIAALAVLNSPFGQRFVADRIAEIAPASGLRIEIGRIDGDLYGEATLHDVVLSDPKGKFLEIPLVELDWRPFSWFARGLDVRKLVAYRGNFLRVPELLPGEEDAPILPDFDIRVDRLELVDFTAAAGVIGDEDQTINAALRADIRDGRAFLKADADISGEDNLAFLLDSEPDADKYDVSLDYRAPAGGFLAGMVGAREDLRVQLFGDGTWSRWQGGLYATQADERLAAIRFTKRDETYDLLGQVDPRDNLTGLPARALGRTVGLRGSGTLADSILEGSFELAGAALRGEAKGAIDLAGNRFDDVEIDARLTDPSLFGDGFQLRGTRLAATLDGAFRDLDIAHTLSAEQVAVGDYLIDGLTQSATAQWDGTRLTLPLEARADRITTGVAQLDPRLNAVIADGELTYTNGRLLSDNLGIRVPGLAARLQLRGELASNTYRLRGPVAARGFELPNIGAADADARIDLSLGGASGWRLNASLDGAVTRVDNATLANLAGPRLDFTGNVALGQDRPILFDNARLTGEKLSLTADGQRRGDGTTTLAGNGTHTQYGAFTFDARLAEDGPVAELVFADPLPAAGLKDVRVALSPIDDGFAIETNGGSTLGPFSGDLNLYAPEGGPVRVEIAELDVAGAKGEGTVEIVDGRARGMIGLVGGGVTGDIALMPMNGGQGFDVNLRAQNATFGGDTPIRVTRGTVEARGVFEDGNSSIDAEIDLAGVSQGSLFLGRAEAEVALRNGSGTVVGSLVGRRGSRFAVNFDGLIEPDEYALGLQGTYDGRRIAMPRRAVLNRLEGGGWELEPAQISYAGGSVIASGRFGGSSGTALSLALDRLPLQVTDVVVADLGLGGQISGLVDYRIGAGGVPVGNARVKIEGLSRSGLVLSSRPIDLFLVADLSATRLETRAIIREDGRTRGRLQGRIANLAPSGALATRLQDGALDAQLRYNGPASALWRLSAVELFDLTGPLEVAANATGSLRDPQINGSLASSSLRFQSAITGSDLTDVEVRGRFTGPRLRLTRFRGNAAGGGTVSGSGFVDLTGLGQKLPTIDLKLAARNASLLSRDDLGATVTGPLRIVSNGDGGTIAGRLRIDSARWQLGAGPAAERLPRIATREINGRADAAPVRQRRAPWRYLIDAVGDNQIDVRGLGLDSEWGANIRLRGTVEEPRIYREANLVRGTYSFAGARFELTRGEIDFSGSSPPNPRLNIVAENDGGGVDATVTITGNALNPQISFSSPSGLGDEEVLSRLLFGDSVTDISAAEALQLGAALASLRGGGGLDPINQLRSAIGLDRLRVVGSDPTIGRGTSVAVGKYFGDRFYAELITDGRDYSATELEFRITSWLSLLASISTIAGESINLEARRDY